MGRGREGVLPALFKLLFRYCLPLFFLTKFIFRNTQNTAVHRGPVTLISGAVRSAIAPYLINPHIKLLRQAKAGAARSDRPSRICQSGSIIPPHLLCRGSVSHQCPLSATRRAGPALGAAASHPGTRQMLRHRDRTQPFTAVTFQPQHRATKRHSRGHAPSGALEQG